MRSKLTLHLDDELIEFGERWGKERGKSLLDVVSGLLTAKVPQTDDELPPITRSLLGVARGLDEADYRRSSSGSTLEDGALPTSRSSSTLT